MTEKEAKEIVKNYVLDHFDDRWSTEHIYLQESPDFFRFFINFKKFFETRKFEHQAVGLGPGFISKKHGDLVQYGSLQTYVWSGHDFLLTEYKLDVIRTRYQISREAYPYDVIICNVKDTEKLSKHLYIKKSLEHLVSGSAKIDDRDCFEFPNMDYFVLLDLLYFNIIDSIGEISFQKRVGGHGHPHQSLNDSRYDNTPFRQHMLERVKELHPTFDIDENYTATITKIHDRGRLDQCLPIAQFSSFRFCKNTGIMAYLDYKPEELEHILHQERKSFEYIKGIDLLFFLFVNIIHPMCNIEIRSIPVNWDGRMK